MPTTMAPSAGRGCGHRKQGGLYLCCPAGPDGTPVWDFVLDPPVPYAGDPFLGTAWAGPELTAGWPDKAVLLLDMVGMETYPTHAAFIEEVRRFGMSRAVPATFPWRKLEGKEVWLGLVHWRALPVWETHHDERLAYTHCRHPGDPAHYGDCAYHSWPLSTRFCDVVVGALIPRPDLQAPPVAPTWCAMPWGRFDPYGVIAAPVCIGDPGYGRQQLEAMATSALPEAGAYCPGLFAVIPVSHVEAIRYVPEGCEVASAGLPVITMEE